jgi:rubrerythrin
MQKLQPINTVPRFFAHAIAIEHEAAERYMEFAEHMRDRSRDVAALFERLAHDGYAHARQLLAWTSKLRLPRLRPGAHAWLDAGTPLPAAHEWVFGLLSPRDALKVAMHAEQRAKRFFGHVVQTTRDRGVRAAAEVFLKEEGEHMGRMKRALKNLPNPVIDWEKIYAHGGPVKAAAQGKAGAGAAAMPGRPAVRKGPPAKKAAAGARPATGKAGKTPGRSKPVRAGSPNTKKTTEKQATKKAAKKVAKKVGKGRRR